jgi:Phage terminase large subunit
MKNNQKKLTLKFPNKSDVFNEYYLNCEIDGKKYNLLTEYDTRTICLYGGGGSGKSKFGVQRTIIKCLKFNDRKVLVVRNVLSTIRDSIFAEFKQCLAEWGLLEHCKVTESYLTIDFPNGSKIMFKGMDKLHCPCKIMLNGGTLL